MKAVPRGVKNALGTVFQRNSLIRVFNELAFFTGMSNLAIQCFRYSSIVEATLPTSLRTVTGYNTFGNCANLKRLEVLEGMTVQNASQWIWESGKTGMLLILPSTLIRMASDTLSTHGNNNTTVIVCKATIPPTKDNTSYHSTIKYVYVPDDSVEAYKAAAGWSQFPAKIKPLSEFVEP